LADPAIREAESILRRCVHCGFCNATCPTYRQLGDELDGPRGRIYLIKEMLENDRPASALTARHIDRCLSCAATCPSGVNYMHLVDEARLRIEASYRRPWADRAIRALLARTLPHAARLRPLLGLASVARRLGVALPGRLGAGLRLAPRNVPGPSVLEAPQVLSAEGARKARVALLTGCVQQVTEPEINEATVRLLRRMGCEVVIAEGAGCCGSLAHHLGRGQEARRAAVANIEAWTREAAAGGLDAVVVNASGCGTHVKDWGFQFRNDPALAAKAAQISALAVDVTELIERLGLPPLRAERASLRVAYHSACSMQHGQKLHALPRKLLAGAGFTLTAIANEHLCCGSAGVYNILQHEIAADLGRDKADALEEGAPDLIATGNIGCITQLALYTETPVLHTVALLDWATGGPRPGALG
jgi:glycolate oxidase iron-sulfur subunit